MLRLTGLPAVAHYPRATVERAGERIVVSFTGDRGAREMDVDPRLVGEEDPEHTELKLLARLQEIGYEVEWRRPDGQEAAVVADDPGDPGSS